MILAGLLLSGQLLPQTFPRSGATVINGRTMTAEQKRQFQLIYHVPPAAGNFWYDPVSGLWGLWGRPPAGFLLPGHTFGSLPRNASAGRTAVFINGREITMVEALFLSRLYRTTIQPSRWWLLSNGNFGLEGSPAIVGNLAVALRRAGGAGGGTETHVEHESGAVNTSSTGCNSVFTTGAGGGSIAAFPGC
jgi:hypothetical protein